MHLHSVFLLKSVLEFHFCADTPQTSVIAQLRNFLIENIVDAGKDTVFIAPAFIDDKIEGVAAVAVGTAVMVISVPFIPGCDTPFFMDRFRPLQFSDISITGTVG